MREVATAAHHIVPFVKFYRGLLGDERDVLLDDALRRFMGGMQ